METYNLWNAVVATPDRSSEVSEVSVSSPPIGPEPNKLYDPSSR